jgi:hypothetical protein
MAKPQDAIAAVTTWAPSNKFCAYALDTLVPGCDGSSGISESSSYMGCFANRNLARELLVQIEGRGWSAPECESACVAEGYDYLLGSGRGNGERLNLQTSICCTHINSKTCTDKGYFIPSNKSITALWHWRI